MMLAGRNMFKKHNFQSLMFLLKDTFELNDSMIHRNIPQHITAYQNIPHRAIKISVSSTIHHNPPPYL